MNSKKILVIGVTASGKGRLAFELARRIGAEIISVDSMKVYRRMDIGTAKPPKEAREKVRYHLIDVVEPSEAFSVGRFLELKNKAVRQIEEQGKPIVAVGGTALYVKAMLYGLFEGPGADEKIREKLKAKAKAEGLGELHRQLSEIDPQAAKRIHPNDARRIIRALEVYELTGSGISRFQQQFDAEEPVENWTIIGLRREKETESKRMNARVKKMIEAGFVEEVQSLSAEGIALSKQARCAIGYVEIIDYLSGKTTLGDAIESIKKNTRHLAKHQRTWFKRFKGVSWLEIGEKESEEDILSRVMEKSWES